MEPRRESEGVAWDWLTKDIIIYSYFSEQRKVVLFLCGILSRHCIPIWPSVGVILIDWAGLDNCQYMVPKYLRVSHCHKSWKQEYLGDIPSS